MVPRPANFLANRTGERRQPPLCSQTLIVPSSMPTVSPYQPNPTQPHPSNFLRPPSRIGEYDRMFDRYELVARPNDHTSVRWTSYRAIWPTRPRDFVIRSTWEEFADGTIVIATRSVDHEGYPETPTFVRGKMASFFSFLFLFFPCVYCCIFFFSCCTFFCDV